MDILTMARELGSALQNSEEYINYKISEQNLACDGNLQETSNKFQEKKLEINHEISKDELDQEKVDKLNKEIGELYAKINENENTVAFNAAKARLQGILGKINTILMKSAAGEDPWNVSEEDSVGGCGGSCGSCGGCC